MEISIRDILAKHPVPGIREAHIRETVARSIQDLFGVEVRPNQITHKEGGLVLSVPPVLKSALLLRFEELQEKLSKEGVSITTLR